MTESIQRTKLAEFQSDTSELNIFLDNHFDETTSTISNVSLSGITLVTNPVLDAELDTLNLVDSLYVNSIAVNVTTNTTFDYDVAVAGNITISGDTSITGNVSVDAITFDNTDNLQMEIQAYDDSLYLRTSNAFSFIKDGTFVSNTNIQGTGTVLMELNGDGDLTVYGNITGFGSLSDFTVKTNLEPIDNAMSKVSVLDAVKFDYIESFQKNDLLKKRQVGVIAQQVEQVLPEAVSEKNGTKYVDYLKIIPLLIQGMKDLQQEINNIKNNNN